MILFHWSTYVCCPVINSFSPHTEFLDMKRLYITVAMVQYNEIGIGQFYMKERHLEKNFAQIFPTLISNIRRRPGLPARRDTSKCHNQHHRDKKLSVGCGRFQDMSHKWLRGFSSPPAGRKYNYKKQIL